MIQINENLLNIIRLIDDENSEIQQVVSQELVKNSLELILNKEFYLSKLNNNQQENFNILLNNIHLDIVSEAFKLLISNALEDINLENSMLILSYWNDNSTDCQSLKNKLDRITNSIIMPNTGHPLAFIDHISNHLFTKFEILEDNEYPENYFLNVLLKMEKGIPATMTILYLIISNRLRIPIFGVPISDNIILKFFNEEDEIFFDPFNTGRKYSKEMLQSDLKKNYEIEKPALDLSSCSNIDVLFRVLRNLHEVYSFKNNTNDMTHQIEAFEEILQNQYTMTI